MKFGILAISILMGSAAFGAGQDWSGCKEEMKKWSCKGDDEAIYQCLLKHDKDLSAGCDKNHSAYEAAHGKK